MKSYKFKQFKKSSGTLVPFSLKKQIPFKTKRMFIIYGNKNFIRGDHAHFKCKQFLIPIFGTMEIGYENKNIKRKIVIDYRKKKGILLAWFVDSRFGWLTEGGLISMKLGLELILTVVASLWL